LIAAPSAAIFSRGESAVLWFAAFTIFHRHISLQVVASINARDDVYDLVMCYAASSHCNFIV